MFLVVALLLGGCSSPASESSGPQPTSVSRYDISHVADPDLSAYEIGRRRDIETRMLSGESVHDGALTLITIGNAESVPALIKHLESQDPLDCARAHTVDALRAITGCESLETYDDWVGWWNQYRVSRLSPETIAVEQAFRAERQELQ